MAMVKSSIQAHRIFHMETLKSTEIQIEYLRSKMVKEATMKGFTNTDVLNISRQLDEILNLHHKLKKKMKHSGFYH